MKITQWGGRPRPPTDLAARDGRPTIAGEKKSLSPNGLKDAPSFFILN
jgi:hypothetical protein